MVPSLHSQGQVPQTSNLPLWAGGMWKRAIFASRCKGQLKEAEQVGTACGWRSPHKLGWRYKRCEKRNTSPILQGSFTEFPKLGSEGPWTPTDESWASVDSLWGYLKFCSFILIMSWKEKSQYKHVLGNLDSWPLIFFFFFFWHPLTEGIHFTGDLVSRHWYSRSHK